MYQGSLAILSTSKIVKLSISRYLYPRQSIDQRLAVLLLLSRCVLKYQRRLVTTINVYILVICSILKFYNKLT